MAWRGEPSGAEQLGIDASVFGFVFLLALLATLFGAKPVSGSKTGNLEISRGFGLAVIAGMLALMGWVTWIAMS
jgi:hypothetical protein